jgi:protoporphyrinogen oxidase
MDSFQSTLNKRVVVIGGGLSGLTAAEELLKQLPNIEVTVL